MRCILDKDVDVPVVDVEFAAETADAVDDAIDEAIDEHDDWDEKLLRRTASCSSVSTDCVLFRRVTFLAGVDVPDAGVGARRFFSSDAAAILARIASACRRRVSVSDIFTSLPLLSGCAAAPVAALGEAEGVPTLPPILSREETSVVDVDRRIFFSSGACGATRAAMPSRPVAIVLPPGEGRLRRFGGVMLLLVSRLVSFGILLIMLLFDTLFSLLSSASATASASAGETVAARSPLSSAPEPPQDSFVGDESVDDALAFSMSSSCVRSSSTVSTCSSESSSSLSSCSLADCTGLIRPSIMVVLSSVCSCRICAFLVLFFEAKRPVGCFLSISVNQICISWFLCCCLSSRSKKNVSH